MSRVLLASLVLLIFGGCSKVFNIGYDKSYCEEIGCDYRDAGVCGNSYDVYKNYKAAKNAAYADFPCREPFVAKKRIIIEER